MFHPGRMKYTEALAIWRQRTGSKQPFVKKGTKAYDEVMLIMRESEAKSARSSVTTLTMFRESKKQEDAAKYVLDAHHRLFEEEMGRNVARIEELSKSQIKRAILKYVQQRREKKAAKAAAAAAAKAAVPEVKEGVANEKAMRKHRAVSEMLLERVLMREKLQKMLEEIATLKGEKKKGEKVKKAVLEYALKRRAKKAEAEAVKLSAEKLAAAKKKFDDKEKRREQLAAEFFEEGDTYGPTSGKTGVKKVATGAMPLPGLASDRWKFNTVASKVLTYSRDSKKGVEYPLEKLIQAVKDIKTLYELYNEKYPHGWYRYMINLAELGLETGERSDLEEVLLQA